MTSDWIKDTLLIRGERIPIKRGALRQSELKFFTKNPRIYSIIRPDEEEPDQEEIEERLQGLPHVKDLIQDIKSNGGLMEPIIVRAKINDVLEGNSRLAAYRKLAESDPIKWGEIDCVVLPHDITEERIFALLGQYHIIGRKDWAPFEQAGFLYRRHEIQDIPQDQIAQELGMNKGAVGLLIRTYQFMVDHNEVKVDRWSYYYELLKSRKLAKLRKENEGFDDLIVEKVRNGEIGKATVIRDELPKLVAAKKTLVRKFMNREATVETVVDRISETGSLDSTYRKLKSFHEWICDVDVQKKMIASNGEVRKKIGYEIKKVNKEILKIHKHLNPEKK